MEPTISAGSFVLVWCWTKNYQTGTIVAFRHDGKIFIKRITSAQTTTIKVHGDNQNDSVDSRQFGLVEKSAVLGTVVWY